MGLASTKPTLQLIYLHLFLMARKSLPQSFNFKATALVDDDIIGQTF
jgi:hypothetical protein